MILMMTIGQLVLVKVNKVMTAVMVKIVIMAVVVNVAKVFDSVNQSLKRSKRIPS